MIRRPPRSTLFPLHDALPIWAMAPHSSTLAWKTPGMEEPGRLQSMGGLKELDTTEQLHLGCKIKQMIWASEEHWRNSVGSGSRNSFSVFAPYSSLKVKPADRFPFVGTRLIEVSGQSGT